MFHRSGEGAVMSNLETPGWRHSIESSCRDGFQIGAAILVVIDHACWFEQVTVDAITPGSLAVRDTFSGAIGYTAALHTHADA